MDRICTNSKKKRPKIANLYEISGEYQWFILYSILGFDTYDYRK